MGLSARIRPATVADAAGIARVQVTTWRATYRGLIPDETLDGMSVERRTERWVENLSTTDDGIESFVASRGDEVQGFAGVGPARNDDDPEPWELYAIYVLPGRQGHGIGRALLGACAARVVERGGASLFAWVLDGNPSTAFYEATGAERRGTSTFPIGGQHIPEVGYRWPTLGALVMAAP
jgi:GNAT superfamily N-acetyltransferase